jgi:hypothetical protein
MVAVVVAEGRMGAGMESWVTNSELETERCPASMAEFFTIWVEWEKSDGSRGKSEAVLNNRLGRREISAVFESVVMEDRALNLGLKGVWIQGAKLEEAKSPEEVARRERLLRQSEVPDPH